MNKKKETTTNNLVSNYMQYVIENNSKPQTVDEFAGKYKFDDSIFFNDFEDFEDLEKHIFNLFFVNTISILIDSDDYKHFDNKNKLLSFYFTFFENLTANRDYVVKVLDTKSNDFEKLQSLSKLKNSFTNYIESLQIITFDLKQKTIEKAQNKVLKESAWLQLILTIKFWLDDDSKDFERTDVLIEKLVNTSFDLINVKALKSVIDLGKFLYKEKVQK